MTATCTTDRPTDRPADRYLLPRRTWRALGTTVQVVVDPASALDAAADAVAAALTEVDRACSRFRDDSDLSRANAAAGSWVEVSSVLLDAVRAAVGAAHATSGLVDPTLGRVMTSLGYDADLAEVRAREDAAALPGALAAHARHAWTQVQIDVDRLLVPAGYALDLGATGKAFAADLSATRAAEVTGADVLVSVGGDIALGRASATGATSRATPWPVGVRELPEDHPDADPGAGHDEVVLVTEGGLATSTTTARRWGRGQGARHHLVDPRTGRPAPEVWRTVTVSAATCVDANTASTAAVVLGAAAVPWLEQRGLAARLVHRDGTVHRTRRWPEPTARPGDLAAEPAHRRTTEGGNA